MLRSLLCIALIVAAAPLHAEEEFVELFNGKNLDGWKGDSKVWSVEDGLLTGKSPEAKEDKLQSNTFAIWDGGEVGDFELIAEFRGIAAERGQQVTLKADDKKEVKPLDGKFDAVELSDWTTLEVKAVGNHLVHKINGDVTVDVTDEDPKNAEAKGLLALQVHAGPDMKVQYRSIKLKKLDK
jgi:hypothetical protein